MVSRKRRDSSRRRSRSRGRRRGRGRREKGSSSSSDSSSSGSKRKREREREQRERERRQPTSRFGGLEAAVKSATQAEEVTTLASVPPVAEANGAGGAMRVIPTPGNLIGGLMGRGGATITGIRKNHPGVTIKVNQPAGNAMAQIIITGDPKMVPSAEVAVCDALMSSPSKGPPGRGMPLQTMPR